MILSKGRRLLWPVQFHVKKTPEMGGSHVALVDYIRVINASLNLFHTHEDMYMQANEMWH